MSEPATIITEPGIYYAMPFAEYRTIDAVNHGLLRTLETKSPLHARHHRDHPSPDTPALRIGRAAHSLILEPDTFLDRWAVAPECDRRTKAGKGVWSTFIEEAGDRDVLSASEFSAIQRMAESIKTQRLQRLVRHGKAEVVMVWTDPVTGLKCKARLDYLAQKDGAAFVIDLKTTKDAGFDAFADSIQKFNYHSQAAYYAMACEELLGQTPGYTWLVAEKFPPYAVAGYQCQSGTLGAGTEFCRRALDRYARCLDNDEWPGFPDAVLPIEMPAWKINQEMHLAQYRMGD